MKYADLVWDHDEQEHARYLEQLAPIVFFCYNRLDHAQQVLAALRANVYAEDSHLFIFSDGAKDEAGQPAVQAVRDYLHQLDGFKEITIIERPENFGLNRNIIGGITEIVNRYGKIIVVEDDIVTSKYFLKYMNDALVIYKDNPKVVGVAGFTEPIPNITSEQMFFNGQYSCWGWATWKRMWDDYDPDPHHWMHRFTKEDIYHFDVEGTFNNWAMTKAVADGTLETWDVQMAAIMFLKHGLMVFPAHTMTRNCGFDNTGVHCGEDTIRSRMQVAEAPVEHFETEDVRMHPEIRKKFRDFYRKYYTPAPLYKRVYRVFRREGLQGVMRKIAKRLSR